MSAKVNHYEYGRVADPPELQEAIDGLWEMISDLHSVGRAGSDECPGCQARVFLYAIIEFRNRALSGLSDARESDPWPVIDWLRENNPQALELCPYKVTPASEPDTDAYPCADSQCVLPRDHDGDHFDSRDGRSWP